MSQSPGGHAGPQGNGAESQSAEGEERKQKHRDHQQLENREPQKQEKDATMGERSLPSSGAWAALRALGFHELSCFTF